MLDAADRGGRALKDVGEVAGAREAAGGLDMLGRSFDYDRHRFDDERHPFKSYMRFRQHVSSQCEEGSGCSTSKASPPVLKQSKTHNVVIDPDIRAV